MSKELPAMYSIDDCENVQIGVCLGGQCKWVSASTSGESYASERVAARDVGFPYSGSEALSSFDCSELLRLLCLRSLLFVQLPRDLQV